MNVYDEEVFSEGRCPENCSYEKTILDRFNGAPELMPYGITGPNSNTFASGLLDGNLPPGAPADSAFGGAPGINFGRSPFGGMEF